MKKRSLKTIFIFCIAIIICSCKKESSSVSVKQQISLVADGVAYSVTTGDAGVIQADAHIRADTVFQLDAEKGDKDFSINCNKIISSGTYTINKNNYYRDWETARSEEHTSNSSHRSLSRMPSSA